MTAILELPVSPRMALATLANVTKFLPELEMPSFVLRLD